MRPAAADIGELDRVLSVLDRYLKPHVQPVIRGRVRRLRPDDVIGWLLSEGEVYFLGGQVPAVVNAARIRAVLESRPPEPDPAEPRRRVSVEDLRGSIIRPRQPV